jgi:hypothetical protein
MASEQNILSWNFANWVTVVLMAAIMFFALGLVQKWMQQKVNGGSAPATA